MDDLTLAWLLEENNPGVRLRTLTELCGLTDDDAQVKAARALVIETLDAARNLSWMNDKVLRPIYGLTALAESGLRYCDVPIDSEVKRLLSQPFDAGCSDYMLLRALVMLGYGNDSRFMDHLISMANTQLPDGGWLCLHRLDKLNRIPKSCMKAAMHALLLAGEMKKRGFHLPTSDALVNYFLRHHLAYRINNPTQLVLDSRPGWRSIDAFFPAEVMRVGLPMLLEALASLGVGRSSELREAWELLDSKKDKQDRIILEGTLTKPYLPKERVGKPSKWMTFYTQLAYRNLMNLTD